MTAQISQRRIAIGISVRESLDGLAGTIASISEHSPRTTRICILADGIVVPAGYAAARIDTVFGVGTRAPRGLPACFNRLVADLDADVFVLLENGARVAPGWLERLLAALDADPTHGLAGPSTNRCWNEQEIYPNIASSPRALAAAATRAQAQFADPFAYLEPLHSLADFCYAVKREVVERIGAADEGYGLGPCWEMDYNVRAARAGFRGVWARGAFVWRAPLTARRESEEARLFTAARHRYQDHFCGLRLRGETQAYESHCTGEACPHFAPRALVQLERPLPQPAAETSITAPAALKPLERHVPRAVTTRPQGRPLVSCIMPTFNRRPYVPAAIEAFLAQDYEPRELIIVDDGTDAVRDLVPDDPRIRYLRESQRLTLGAKRNLACSLANGDVIAHWDDDDWHAPSRLTYQVGELLARQADLCGVDQLLFYDPAREQAWQYRYPGGRSRWVAGGTFCYRRSLWERHRFANISIGEDTRFVREATSCRVLVLERRDFYVARVHEHNTSRKHTAGASWHSVSAGVVRDLLASSFASPPASATDRTEAETAGPLVSCIMPTADRRAFVPLALTLFLRQSYPHRELIVIDDGRDPVRDLMPADPRVRYIRLDRRESLGRKRNVGCEAARGEIVAHWDDDDWYGPDRLDRQVSALRAGHGQVVALSMTYLLELQQLRFWRCSPAHHARLHFRDLCPGTVAYWHALWRRSHGYPAVNCTEDVQFLKSLPASTQFFRLPEESHFICVRHGANTWNITLDWSHAPGGWSRVPTLEFLPQADRNIYATLSETVRPSPVSPVPMQA